MSANDWSEFKEIVRTQTDLVSLVSESMTLTPMRGGSEFKGLCPFHDDHNPSFCVYPDRQSYRCWVCDEGGDCFSWVMKTESVGFREALESLARRANLEIPKSQRGNGQNEPPKTGLLEVLQWADNEFHQCFLRSPEAAAARDYILGRGFSEEIINQFRIGYHPNDWEWLQNRAKGRFTPQQLLSVKLVGESERRPGYYDNFVDRVLFPIRDAQGRPVAFGGRILPGNSNPNLAKYWNSPESAVFTKSKLLYGLDAARPSINKSKTAVVVEGYTDCIIAHQHGVRNVVGTLGTSLTETHVGNLKRFANRVVLIFDGDTAGRNAAGRAVPKFLAQSLDLRILTLPEELDPADYLEQHGAEAFGKLIETAPEGWEFQLDAELERNGSHTMDGVHRTLDAMLTLIKSSPGLAGTSREDVILSKLSQRLGLQEHVVRQHYQKIRRPVPQKRQPSGENGSNQEQLTNPTPQQEVHFLKRKHSKNERLECELLEILLSVPEWIGAIRQEVGASDFWTTELRAVLEICFDALEEGEELSFERIITRIEEPSLKSIVVWLEDQAKRKQIPDLLRTPASDITPKLLDDLFEQFRMRREQLTQIQLKGELARTSQEGNVQDDDALLRKITDYHRKRATRRKPNDD
ncbi:MAG: DNA primase [Planctomycetaceae bacterium]|nr:DNA primase [Planctomycetaceae bacterium]